jgi:hypothetical protein
MEKVQKEDNLLGASFSKQPCLSKTMRLCSTIITVQVLGNRFKQYVPNSVLCLPTAQSCIALIQ